jgi:formate dehydrogenase accessory protein FdhE
MLGRKMKAPIRGGPTEFDVRRQRALDLVEAEPTVGDLLEFLAVVLGYQQGRASNSRVQEAVARLTSSFDLDSVADVIAQEHEMALATLAPFVPFATIEAAQGFFLSVAEAPIVEGAAAKATLPSTERWQESSCPICGALPKVSVIAEESGEFMRGAARYLICSRCATAWGFARATCPNCRQHHPDRLGVFVNERWPWARVDSCDACKSYIKTFDLRQPGSNEIVPLVDDVATLSLDLWAVERGFHPLGPVLTLDPMP